MKKTKRPLNTWVFLGIYLAILAVFVGVYVLTKAMNKPAPVVGTGSYTPGTYTGVGPGKNGDITVEVTVNENTIQSVKVVSHDETPGLSDGAIADIPAKIVATQSLGVDSVSGATVSSEGIVAAVADAVAKAGGDVDALKNVAIAAGEHTTKSLSADVIVVGGGGAGMTAAAPCPAAIRWSWAPSSRPPTASPMTALPPWWRISRPTAPTRTMKKS